MSLEHVPSVSPCGWQRKAALHEKKPSPGLGKNRLLSLEILQIMQDRRKFLQELQDFL
jgi:hypothetical protein